MLAKLLSSLASVIVGGLFKLAAMLVPYLVGKRAGKTAEEAQDRKEVLDAVERAQDARRAVDNNADSLLDDKYNRD